jgi:hypothetical protein
MNAKRKGTRNEHRSIRLLEAAGYACTRRRDGNSQGVPRAGQLPQAPHRWRYRQRTPDVREVSHT